MHKGIKNDIAIIEKSPEKGRIATFVAGALRDKQLYSLLEENKRLREKPWVIQVLNPSNNSVLYEASLKDAYKAQDIYGTHFCVDLPPLRHTTGTKNGLSKAFVEDTPEIEIRLGGVTICHTDTLWTEAEVERAEYCHVSYIWTNVRDNGEVDIVGVAFHSHMIKGLVNDIKAEYGEEWFPSENISRLEWNVEDDNNKRVIHDLWEKRQ